jgi:hypothetical protein
LLCFALLYFPFLPPFPSVPSLKRTAVHLRPNFGVGPVVYRDSGRNTHVERNGAATADLRGNTPDWV